MKICLVYIRQLTRGGYGLKVQCDVNENIVKMHSEILLFRGTETS